MKETFDVAEPPEVCPVDIPVLFDSRHDAAATVETDAGGCSREAGKSGDEEDGVYQELDACMAALKGLKAEVLRKEGNAGGGIFDCRQHPCSLETWVCFFQRMHVHRGEKNAFERVNQPQGLCLESPLGRKLQQQCSSRVFATDFLSGFDFGTCQREGQRALAGTVLVGAVLTEVRCINP